MTYQFLIRSIININEVTDLYDPYAWTVIKEAHDFNSALEEIQYFAVNSMQAPFADDADKKHIFNRIHFGSYNTESGALIAYTFEEILLMADRKDIVEQLKDASRMEIVT